MPIDQAGIERNMDPQGTFCLREVSYVYIVFSLMYCCSLKEIRGCVSGLSNANKYQMKHHTTPVKIE